MHPWLLTRTDNPNPMLPSEAQSGGCEIPIADADKRFLRIIAPWSTTSGLTLVNFLQDLCILLIPLCAMLVSSLTLSSVPMNISFFTGQGACRYNGA